MNKDEKRQARILALQVFFSYEQQKFEGDINSIFDEIANFSDIDDEEKSDNLTFITGEINEIIKVVADSPADLSEEVRNYALEIVKFAAQNRENIDAAFSNSTPNWAFERISTIDRNLLRVAIAELDEKFDVPPKVVINEAIEIAKIFGTDDSAKFVNAVLDRVKNEKGK